MVISVKKCPVEVSLTGPIKFSSPVYLRAHTILHTYRLCFVCEPVHSLFWGWVQRLQLERRLLHHPRHLSTKESTNRYEIGRFHKSNVSKSINHIATEQKCHTADVDWHIFCICVHGLSY